jgi:hypothetical protein
MFPSLVRRANLPGQVPFDFENNPYRAKQWPPDFSKLSSKYQFRLERRYRRRAKLAWARPRWTKFTKLVQYGASLCMYPSSRLVEPQLNVRSVVIGYGVLYYDWGQQNPDKVPFKAVSNNICTMVFFLTIVGPRMVQKHSRLHLDTQLLTTQSREPKAYR